ncbi:MAG: hypothetical protein SFV19_14610 [Rhodospirillaceae bacterium]|nr:hypothetical protein [Rhodospirillaceae bacterium]
MTAGPNALDPGEVAILGSFASGDFLEAFGFGCNNRLHWSASPTMSKVWPHLQKRKRREPDAQLLTRPLGGRLRFAFTVLALLITLGVVLPQLYRERDDLTEGAKVTDCDRLAAHPSDTQRLAPGVTQAEVEIARARKACHQALDAAPGDGRILYQLGRTYFYDRDYERGIGYFRQSAAAGYAQGQFVLGLILVQGNGIEPDTCAGGALWVKAARQRHLYSKIYLANNWLDGMFSDCDLAVTEQELDGMVSAAEEFADTETQKDDVATLRKNWENRKR